MMNHALALLLIGGVATAALAQDFAWSENVGWVNTAVACSPAAARSVPDPTDPTYDAHLAGYLWGENIGWINLGQSYEVNASYPADGFGVNVAPDGTLSGFAWAENVGWVNFAPAGLDPVYQPLLAGSRLLGYAWAENIGWINMDLSMPEPGLYCGADLDHSGVLNFDDIDMFVVAFTSNSLCANLDANGLLNLDDIDTFVSLFLGGCI